MNFSATLPRVRAKLTAEARRLNTDQQRSDLTRTSTTLEERLKALRRALEQLQALKKHGFDVAGSAEQSRLVRTAWQNLQRGTKSDVEKLAGLPGERWAALKQAEQKLEAAVLTAYRAARWQLLPPAVPRFYARLARSGPLQDAYARLTEVDAALQRQLPEKLPAKLDSPLAEARALRASRDAARAALDREVPEGVQQLLARVEEKQATLADVTTETLAWLRQHQADTELQLGFPGAEDRS